MVSSSIIQFRTESYAIAILAGLAISYVMPLYQNNEIYYDIRVPPPEYHVHADFLVVVNSEAVNFMRPEFDAVDPGMHIHVLNFMGDKVIHVHSRGAALGDFFYSLGMDFNSTCFVSDAEYCNNSTHALRFYVNGQLNDKFGEYKIQELDRMLITYGNYTQEEINGQLDLVTSISCVFSGSCEAPPEAEDKILYN